MKGPLKGIRVLEFEGLAPTVFTGMVLADFGADVAIISRLERDNPIGIDTNSTYLNRGKRSIAANIKDPNHIFIIKQLMEKADIVIDCFRPGKLEQLGLGPADIENKRLIFARITGYGQTGPLTHYAGHDINYLGYSGLLSTFGKEGRNPDPPNNILADFGGGGAFGVIGILLALFERERTGKGQVVDVALADCVGYLGSFLSNMKRLGVWNNVRGNNLLDGGAPFYQTYQCKDGKYLAVGCIENQFYRRFLKGINIEDQDKLANNQYNVDDYPHLTKTFQHILQLKTRDDWMHIFEPLDCCVSPVLEMSEIQSHPQTQKLIFKESDKPHAFQYKPQPLLSLYQSMTRGDDPPCRGEQTVNILREYGISSSDIIKFTSPTAKI